MQLNLAKHEKPGITYIRPTGCVWVDFGNVLKLGHRDRGILAGIWCLGHLDPLWNPSIADYPLVPWLPFGDFLFQYILDLQ